MESICACDGKVYDGQCSAAVAGSDLDVRGTCPVPDGSFACGYVQCKKLTQYCEHTPGTGGAADTYACKADPSCASQFPTCACLANEPCGSMCTGDSATGLVLTCP